MIKLIRNFLTIICAVFLMQACSMSTFVIRQTGAILDYGVEALYEESDLKLAEQALASDIKLLEGMLKGDPENENMLLLTTQALSGYAMGFAEDEEPERAKSLYLRGKDYGLRILRMDDRFAQNENGTIDEFTDAVNAMDKDYIAAFFWTGFAWAGWINLSLDNPRALIDLTKVEVLMQRVLDLDENFFHGSVHLFFGSVWGTKPKMLGGDPEKAKFHFEKNLEITQGKFLLTYVYYARYYAAITLNEDLFNQFIVKIEETPTDILPHYQLLNAIAKKKVKYLNQIKKDLF